MLCLLLKFPLDIFYISMVLCQTDVVRRLLVAINADPDRDVVILTLGAGLQNLCEEL